MATCCRKTFNFLCNSNLLQEKTSTFSPRSVPPAKPKTLPKTKNPPENRRAYYYKEKTLLNNTH
jgi:hypothetical protein